MAHSSCSVYTRLAPSGSSSHPVLQGGARSTGLEKPPLSVSPRVHFPPSLWAQPEPCGPEADTRIPAREEELLGLGKQTPSRRRGGSPGPEARGLGGSRRKP